MLVFAFDIFSSRCINAYLYCLQIVYLERWDCYVYKVRTVTNLVCEIGANSRSALRVRVMAMEFSVHEPESKHSENNDNDTKFFHSTAFSKHIVRIKIHLL